jgi:hypothetical protein
LPEPTREEVIARLRGDRWLAHQRIFANRHPEKSCPAHRELVDLIHGPHARFSFEGFRGVGKTTYLEEAALLRALFGEFKYMVIVSANFRPLAIQRLAAIKREIEVNREIERLFGNVRGVTWQEGMITLTNGTAIQALGRDMSVTGMKYLDTRPDALLIDDVEDPEETRSDVERKATWEWLLKTLMPSLDNPITSWVRALGTRRGQGSLPERLERAGWPVFKVPIEYLDEQGERRATWPAKFPLPVIDRLKQDYRGDLHTYVQEYMCRAVADDSRVFLESKFRRVTRTRTYEPVWAMYDPARTVGRNSATTGKAVWSWVGGKLIVWRGEAHKWLPTEMVEDIFRTAAEFDPIYLGVEDTGLSEWIREPLRTEQIRRGLVVPLKPVNAPRRKLDFIRGLQLFFEAGEVEFAEDCPDLRSQLLSFPEPPIDAPNALAYALLLKPGMPMIDGFREEHVVENLAPSPWRPSYLAVNARDRWTTAALCQYSADRLVVVADWAYEGPPEEHVASIAVDGQLASAGYRMLPAARPSGFDALKIPDTVPVMRRAAPSWVAPDWHWDRWMNVGLVQAINRLPAVGQRGGSLPDGRAYLADSLQRMRLGEVVVQVGSSARWTLRALTGGYCRARNSIEAETGPYRCLMEGIESWAALMTMTTDEEETEPNWSFDRQGRRYASAIPARHH